jgi:hypothetical protein
VKENELFEKYYKASICWYLVDSIVLIE